MSDEEHLRRPKLERSEPIRSFSTLVGAGRAGTSPRSDTANPSLGDAFSRAVDVGYRVIDEYIRQGQQAAERIRKGDYNAEAATADFQDLAVRMTRSASDLMETWLQLVAGATGAVGSANVGWAAGRANVNPDQAGNGRPPAEPNRWTDAQREPAPPGSARPAGSSATTGEHDEARVRIEVQASCPTEVSLDLRAGAARRRLRVHALRSVDLDKPRLEATLTGSADGEEPSVLRVLVPSDHPPGTYHGLILDEDANRPLGTLTVKILSGPQEAGS